MKQLFILIILSLAAIISFSQQTYITKGKIEFEKKENVYRSIDMMAEQWDKVGSDWIDNVKKNTQQFAINYYDLYFDGNKSLYKSGREVPDQKTDNYWQSAAKENVIFTDLQQGRITAQKKIYGSIFLIEDSFRTIEWRYTNETREIAGFECHKAVGRMLDSIYVVAFYTNQILTNSGPESFNGLPGMILGLAIPRLNTTWFATKLELAPITPTDLTPPAKGKKLTYAAYDKTLIDLMKDWGKYGKRRMLQAII